METNRYELKLLVNAVKSRLTKHKRVRGSGCIHESISILPIREGIPEDFKVRENEINRI